MFKRAPEQMYRALTLHNNVIRHAKYVSCGSIIQQEGDSFTLAFHTAFDAVAFCLQVCRGGAWGGESLASTYAWRAAGACVVCVWLDGLMSYMASGRGTQKSCRHIIVSLLQRLLYWVRALSDRPFFLQEPNQAYRACQTPETICTCVSHIPVRHTSVNAGAAWAHGGALAQGPNGHE